MDNRDKQKLSVLRQALRTRVMELFPDLSMDNFAAESERLRPALQGLGTKTIGLMKCVQDIKHAPRQTDEDWEEIGAAAKVVLAAFDITHRGISDVQEDVDAMAVAALIANEPAALLLANQIVTVHKALIETVAEWHLEFNQATQRETRAAN